MEFGGKSPVSALNELGVRVAYSVLKQRGPAHCPSFTVAVAVSDVFYYCIVFVFFSVIGIFIKY